MKSRMVRLETRCLLVHTFQPLTSFLPEPGFRVLTEFFIFFFFPSLVNETLYKFFQMTGMSPEHTTAPPRFGSETEPYVNILFNLHFF